MTTPADSSTKASMLNRLCAIDDGCVCAQLPNGEYKTKTDWPKEIINCGNCGACSNCHDVQIYANSAADQSGNIFSQLFDFPCALIYLGVKLSTGGNTEAARAAAGDCLRDNTAALNPPEGPGFTDDCLVCWVAGSMLCSVRRRCA